MAQDVSHYGAVDGGVLWRREEKGGVNAGHLPVDLGYGALKLKVGRCAKASQYMAATLLFGKVYGQPVISLHSHFRPVGKDGLDEVDASLGREHAPLLGVDANGDHNLVKDLKPAQHDALVTHGKGVE